MTDYEKICDFGNLYKAHTAARRSKRDTSEVIDFELKLSKNLTEISDSLKNHTYKMSGYYSFMIHDPKDRVIHALHYRDRVVQHCICDEVLGPLLEKKLIYDNAACREGKGNLFAMERVCTFLRKYYAGHGTKGYILKCDIRKFFDNIDHNVLKEKLKALIKDSDVLWLLYLIIDSYEVTPGKGLPLGNQTSQWFALYYLDGFDRLIKEKLQIKYYSRYMDDCVLIHESKDYLKECRKILEDYINTQLHIEFNDKTQIFPISAGVDYLGYHLYLTDTGKVVKKVRQQTKYKFKRKVKYLVSAYADYKVNIDEVKQVLSGYNAHLKHGNTFMLRKKILESVVFCRNNIDKA